MARKVPADYQPEPGEWVGEPGERIDSGKVAQSDRWWPDRWWAGHHMKRDKTGKWAGHQEGFRQAPARLLQPRKPVGETRRRTSADQLRADYKAYLENRHNQAEAATRGHMLTPRAERRGVKTTKWFNGRAGVSRRDASEELRDWFRANGPNLTYSEFRLQRTERRGAAAGWFGRQAA